MTGNVTVVGLGPGGASWRTPAATQVLESADLIVGYSGYMELICDVAPATPRLSTGMTGEVDRCTEAVRAAAEGKRVAVICSGDGGIYAMAGLVCQLAAPLGVPVHVEPGVTAAFAAAALMGAPLGHDLAFISLSDRLTPWALITRRLELAAQADLCLCLYNPVSKGRPDHLSKACQTLMTFIEPSRPCGWARQVARPGQAWGLCRLDELGTLELDMFSLCIVGNSCTRVIDGRLVTPRGYRGVE